MEGRFSGCEDKEEEMNSSVKENGISKKIPNTKHPGNLGYYEKVKGQYTRLTYKNSATFLYTNHKYTERETRKTLPFTIALKRKQNNKRVCDNSSEASTIKTSRH